MAQRNEKEEMRINIIGSGNVATHLAKALSASSHDIICIASRKIEHASQLAFEVNAKAITDLSELENADVTILCVSDSAIGEVAKELSRIDSAQTILHTSGATSLNVLNDFDNRGVLYPCMTFSKNDAIDMSQCPFLTEAHTPKVKYIISEIVTSLGARETECDSERRSHIHVAAVFASNFTNHMLTLAKKVMDKEQLPFDVLQPLVNQTISKGFKIDPHDAQTGPARRHDTSTIERHCDFLSFDDNLLNIYKTLTESIEKSYEI